MNSRKTLLAAALLCGLARPAHATAVSDTLVIEDVSRIKIETRDTVQRIVISGAKDDPQFHYTQRISIPDTSAVRRKLSSVKDFTKVTIHSGKDRNRSLDFSLHANLGLNTMLSAPEGYSFKLWPSIEYGLCVTADWHPYGPRNQWSVGLGIGYRSYRLSDDSYWVKDPGGMLTLTPYDKTVVKDTETKLNTFFLQVPLLYTHHFDEQGQWGLTLGAIVNINTSANAYRSYEYGGEEFEVKTKSIGQRPVTIDGIVVLHLPQFPAIYCKYSPFTFFKDGRGPKMHQLSFGLCL